MKNSRMGLLWLIAGPLVGAVEDGRGGGAGSEVRILIEVRCVGGRFSLGYSRSPSGVPSLEIKIEPGTIKGGTRLWA